MDMCSKQMAAFSSYLSSIDTQHRDWRWQLKSSEEEDPKARDKRIWDALESTSNAAEQAGQKGYRTGKNVPLLAAIQNAIQIDLQEIREYDAHDRDGIRHVQRSAASLTQRYFPSKDREIQSQERDDEITILSDEDETLEYANSSGLVHLPRGRASSKARKSSQALRLSRSPSVSASRSSPMRSAPTVEETRLPSELLSLQRQALSSSQALQQEQEKFGLEKERLKLEQEKLAFEKERLAWERERRGGRGETRVLRQGWKFSLARPSEDGVYRSGCYGITFKTQSTYFLAPF
ncbi:hypothetical protein CC78DRAFT_545498 [Lojkania enalia]|uniref:Uncharacterized protein n=1 Tax=Lojkania enalia TaxID=147567 RepID=A0A9P4K5A2_9PLEO|nr:hypothetical protein CC78DRAFT_545498 [Didymosphaeria enalia]